MTESGDQSSELEALETAAEPDAAAEGWADHSLGQDDAVSSAPGTLPPGDPAPPPAAGPPPAGWSQVPYTQGPTMAPTGVPTGMPSQIPAPGRSQLLPWVVIGALIILIVILLGALNSRDYHLIRSGDRMEVKRGGWVLGTMRDLAPEELGRSNEYSPIDLPAGVHVENARFGEREDLKRAMVDLVLKILTPVMAAGEIDRVEQLAKRLDAFQIPPDVQQDPAHRKLLSRVSMLRGRRAESSVRDGLMKARQHFQRAHLFGSPNARGALRRLHRVEGFLQGDSPEPLSQSKEMGKGVPANGVTEF